MVWMRSPPGARADEPAARPSYADPRVYCPRGKASRFTAMESGAEVRRDLVHREGGHRRRLYGARLQAAAGGRSPAARRARLTRARHPWDAEPAGEGNSRIDETPCEASQPRDATTRPTRHAARYATARPPDPQPATPPPARRGAPAPPGARSASRSARSPMARARRRRRPPRAPPRSDGSQTPRPPAPGAP